MKSKKSLGQNFLKSKSIINIIIKTADLKENDIVLEIGPGKGILTEKLLEKVKKVIVVEKDNRLIDFLKEKFKNQLKLNKLEIIYGDILDFDIKINKKYKIVANIPYYITGKIIKKFLSSENQPKKMILMVQKEVAKRITQLPESILSISVKVYGEPKYIQKVKAENFKPKPKVDSAILLINNISKDFFIKNNINEKDFFNLIKSGFSHKRKLLLNNILNNWDKNKLEKEKLKILFNSIKIPFNFRAEQLSIDDWKNLYKSLKI